MDNVTQISSMDFDTGAGRSTPAAVIGSPAQIGASTIGFNALVVSTRPGLP